MNINNREIVYVDVNESSTKQVILTKDANRIYELEAFRSINDTNGTNSNHDDMLVLSQPPNYTAPVIDNVDINGNEIEITQIYQSNNFSNLTFNIDNTNNNEIKLGRADLGVLDTKLIIEDGIITSKTNLTKVTGRLSITSVTNIEDDLFVTNSC